MDAGLGWSASAAVSDRLTTAHDIDDGRREPEDQTSHGQGRPPHHGQAPSLQRGRHLGDPTGAHHRPLLLGPL